MCFVNAVNHEMEFYLFFAMLYIGISLFPTDAKNENFMRSHAVCELCKATSRTPLIDNGLLYGVLFGTLLGTILAGPHFFEWPVSEILGAITLCAAGFGAVAYFFVELVYGGLIAGDEVALSVTADADDETSDWGMYDD